MKPVQDGYDLGIIVPAWWWDKVKARCPKPMKEDNYYLPGSVALILGTISYREFDLYWEPVEWPGALYDESAKQVVDRRDRRDDQRNRLGWKKVDWPHDKVEHKYFTVEHWRI